MRDGSFALDDTDAAHAGIPVAECYPGLVARIERRLSCVSEILSQCAGLAAVLGSNPDIIANRHCCAVVAPAWARHSSGAVVFILAKTILRPLACCCDM